MTLQLFRPKFLGSSSPAMQSRSFHKTDTVLAKYLNIHTATLAADAISEVSVYGRDCMVEWDGALTVRRHLLGNPTFDFTAWMRNLGYKKPIFGNDMLAEGGRYIFGKKFILASDLHVRDAAFLEYFLKNVAMYTNTYLPIHFVPSITSTSGRHIDCDYQIIDTLKLIYISQNAANTASLRWPGENAKKRLEDIAELYGYAVRTYPRYFDNHSLGKQTTDALAGLKGINSIIANETLFTGAIHPDEKKWLDQQGIAVEIMPLHDVDFGAGLRCVYGEFNT